MTATADDTIRGKLGDKHLKIRKKKMIDGRRQREMKKKKGVSLRCVMTTVFKVLLTVGG